MPTPKNNHLDPRKKILVIAGIPISVSGGLQDGDAAVMTPGGPRRVLVRGLYGEAVWIKQNNNGHYVLSVNTLEISELNTVLHAAQVGDAQLPVLYEDGFGSTFSGTFMVMTDPEMKISNTVVPHIFLLESADFTGVLVGRVI